MMDVCELTIRPVYQHHHFSLFNSFSFFLLLLWPVLNILLSRVSMCTDAVRGIFRRLIRIAVQIDLIKIFFRSFDEFQLKSTESICKKNKKKRQKNEIK